MKKISELSIADLKAAHEFVKASLEKHEEDKTEESDEKVKASEKMSKLENYLYHELLNRVLSLEPLKLILFLTDSHFLICIFDYNLLY